MGYAKLVHPPVKRLTRFKEGTFEIGSMVFLSMVVRDRALSV